MGLATVKLCAQVTDNLLGKAPVPSDMDGEHFPWEETMKLLYEKVGGTAIYVSLTFRAWVFSLFGKHEEAIAALDEGAPYSRGGASLYFPER